MLAYVTRDSPRGAQSIARAALDSADSRSTMAERGRIVPELSTPSMRETFVFRYRLIYRIDEDRVAIIAFLHGARDFARWRRSSGN